MNIEGTTCDSFVTKTTRNECNIKPMDSNITFNSISVSVLPPNVDWLEMEGFNSRKYGPFAFNFTNSNNRIISGISFYITYNCNGKFNSAGRFLADVTVSPKTIFADSGYYFTCNVTATNPINYGTKADPIPGINLKVQMQVKSYNKLILNEDYYSLANPSTPKDSSILTKSLNSINLISSDNLAVSKNSNSVDSSTNFYTPNKSTCSNTSRTCSNELNTIERYCIVNVRGDCQASIIVADGY